MKLEKIVVITGGGHISTFGAGLKGAALEAEERDITLLGALGGYEGLEKGDLIPLSSEMIDEYKAGSIIGSKREKANPEKIAATLRGQSIDGVVVLGGNDHLGEAAILAESGLPIVGWPKTMDNDLSRTEFTFGFPTAVSIAAQGISEAHVDAVTNRRVDLIGLFGRNTDWVVATAGTWGGADLIIGGEAPIKDGTTSYTLPELYTQIKEAARRNALLYGVPFAVVAVSEAAKISGLPNYVEMMPVKKDIHGNPKLQPAVLVSALAEALETYAKSLGEKFSVTGDIITYAMRNKSPTDFERILGIEAGRETIRMLVERDTGKSVVLVNGGKYTLGRAPLGEVKEQRKLLPEGHMDYGALKANQSLVHAYTQLLGEVPSKERHLEGLLLKR